MTNPSGQSGLLGRVADWWDRKPVKGPLMVAAVTAIGVILAMTNGGPKRTRDPEACRATPLLHVYRPSRLQIVATCQTVTGTVAGWRLEHDGDFHVAMTMDQPGWVNASNRRRQHGFTVVEFVPLLPRAPRFYGGMRLRLLATRVLDRQHGSWVEAHPVFAWRDVTPPGTRHEPNHPSLAPPTEDPQEEP